MMGQTILTKSLEEIANDYHPNLRRFTAGFGADGHRLRFGHPGRRGSYHAHALAPGRFDRPGQKEDYLDQRPKDLPVIGDDLKPGEVARQTLNGSWAPVWFGNLVDGKTLPAQFTATYKQWGGYGETPLFRRSYLGENYGMASIDVSNSETVPFMAHWRREAQKVDSMLDLGTLLIRGGANRTELLDSQFHGTQSRNPNGIIGNQGNQLGDDAGQKPRDCFELAPCPN